MKPNIPLLITASLAARLKVDETTFAVLDMSLKVVIDETVLLGEWLESLIILKDYMNSSKAMSVIHY